ncbi:MAG TPA: ROK family protein [Steroidobacteraceae bacterium]|nr:ROK family protein [Steroidobacteraceae bacterium]
MNSPDTRLFGAIEAGGTKFVCAVGDAVGQLRAEHRFATTEPRTTLAEAAAFLREGSGDFGPLAAIGVAAFGPIELDRRSAGYGCILRTPKPGWSGTNMLAPFAEQFSCPIGFDTDVNAAASAEHRWGAARGADPIVYVTVGTGIGGGVLVNGEPLHGLMHPEIGHIYPRRHAYDADFAGVCPFHGDCLEGLAGGPAIVARSGALLDELAHGHPQWDIEADYLAQLCAQLVLTVSPRRIVLGGGVMSQVRLLPMIRDRMRHWLRGYVDRPELSTRIDEYVVAPGLGSRSGVLGALSLAVQAAAPHSHAPGRLHPGT